MLPAWGNRGGRQVSAATTAAASAGVSASTACAHCALPVPAGLIRADRQEQFCCGACELGYSIIHAGGMDEFYRLRAASGSLGPAARSTRGSRRYGEFDDATFQRLYTTALPDGTARTELLLEGVHCAACVWLLERLPGLCPGVVESRLNFRRATLEIRFDPARVKLSEVARSLDALGYIPHPARGVSARAVRAAEDRASLVRLGVAGACAGNVMLLAAAMYTGLFDAMEAEYQTLFRWLSMGISLVSLAWPGSVFFRSAWGALRSRAINLDVPIALGLAAGAISGVANTVLGRGEIYFDSLAVLVFALLLGRRVQRTQQRWAADAVELLFSLTPSVARRVEDGRVTEIPVEALSPGDLVEVRAGECVPVDGVVEAGESEVDRSILTGEGGAVRATVGDAAAAGTTNLVGTLRIRARATGEQTRIAKLMHLVEDGSRRRAPIVRAADRIAGIFVVVMSALAVGVGLAWLWIDPSRALDNAAALLIVTCPCALGLATPLAVTVAVGRSARRGILLKGGEALEALARPGVIFLDKTGTITQGRPALTTWVGQTEALRLACALERESTHPIARAFAESPEASHVKEAGVRAVSTIGGGLEGDVVLPGAAPRAVAIGSLAFISTRAQVPPWALDAHASMAAKGLTAVLVMVDGQVSGAAGLGDAIRPDSARAVDELRGMGWRVGVLSGDHPGAVHALGASLNIPPADLHAGLSPEDKVAQVEEAARSAPVVMVGDGVNDAAALAAATVGVAVHGGAEASLSAGQVYLTRPGLTPLVELIGAARRTMSTIRLNLTASVAYNITAAALAATGVINPLIAAVLMPVSSLTVVALSLRARTYGDSR